MKPEIKEKREREYELAFLIADEAHLSQLLALLETHKAKVIKPAELKLVRLSYKIKKLSQAYFGFLRFTSESDAPKAIEHALRTAAYTVRTMIMVIPVKKAKKQRAPKEDGKPAAPRTAAPVMEALSNEDLEKKIEEILA